ncbi:MAG TPA: di-heme oxidoredictase family protein [Gemmatimonadales bacterium]
MTRPGRWMRDAATLVLLLCLGGACRRPPQPGDPVQGLSRAERQRFDDGRVMFDSTFVPATGLGPLFNADACGECHEEPATGGFGDEIELHATAFRPTAPLTCDPLVDAGGPVFQQRVTDALRAALAIDSEPVPPAATGRGLRSSPDVLGFGLLDAVPDSAILALSDPTDANGDGISGRPNFFFDGRLGRFGRKAFVPALRDFNAGAFVIEQSVTNPASPNEERPLGRPVPEGTDPVPDPELNQEAIDLTDFFVRFLAPPAPARLQREARVGRDVFSRLGCATCHVPSLRTGLAAAPPLRNLDVAAYTDLLVHDMGPDLADICLGLATPSEFRTEPLMGLRLMTRFMHDGRATTVEQAIELHGGEAAPSRDRFRGLPAAERAATLAFLKTL